MKRISTPIRAGLAACLLLISQVIAPTQVAFAAPGGQLQQVFCNIQGNSGQWKAQIGGPSTEHEYPLLVNGQPVYVHDEHDVTTTMDQQCQSQYGVTVIAVPAIPAINDPCGTGNATWAVPSNTAAIHWTVSGQDHLIATTQQPYVFVINGHQTTTYDYGVAIETNKAPCVTKITKPTVPVIDACGPNNIVYGTVPTSSNYTFVRNSDGSITFTAKMGYVFDDGSANGVTTYTLPVLSDSGVLCNTEPIPATPQVVDPCGDNNAYWIVPSDTSTVHWSIVNGELIATAIGVLFTNGQSTINFGAPADSGKCRVVLPTPPAPIDPCGAGNATWNGMPANTSSYVWSLNAGSLAVTATADYMFSDGTTYHNFGLAPDSGALCPAPQVVNPTCDTPGSITLPAVAYDGYTYHYVVSIGLQSWTYDTNAVPKTIAVTSGTQVHVMLIREDPWDTRVFDQLYTFALLPCIEIPATPTPADPCGANNAYWVKPTDSDTVTWTIDESGHLIASPVGALFTDGSDSHDYGVVTDSGMLCAPPAPHIIVQCGLYNNDIAQITQPNESEHYYWTTYWDGDTLVVTAVPDNGYWFDETTDSSWSFTDQHTSCTMPSLTTTPKQCHADATVSVEYDTERYYYTIQLDDGEELPLDSGTTTLTNIGTYTVRAYEYRYSDDERMVSDESDGLVFTDTFTVSAPSCEPGKGSITPLPTPIELPHTGSDGITGWIVALISAATVYGAVYFAQPRRQ